MLEDFMNNNGACLYLRHCGHKLYYVEVWKIRLKPISKTGGAVYPADTIYVLMDNIKDFIKFLKEYTFAVAMVI